MAKTQKGDKIVDVPSYKRTKPGHKNKTETVKHHRRYRIKSIFLYFLFSGLKMEKNF